MLPVPNVSKQFKGNSNVTDGLNNPSSNGRTVDDVDVDTLFQVNEIPSSFSISDDGCRNGIKPRVIKRLIVLQHAVNRMQ